MKRQAEREQIQRLSVKTLDQVFMARACEGLGCSMFESQALTELIKEVYFPWLPNRKRSRLGNWRWWLSLPMNLGTSLYRSAK